MSRRALPVAVAAAALVLVPSTASAAPDQTPQTMVGESLYADARGSLSDGRQFLASLNEARTGPGGDRRASVSITLSPGQLCWPTTLCDAGTGHAWLELDPEDLDFDRNLDQASVENLQVTLQRSVWAGGMTWTYVEEEVQVSLTFTGTGGVVRDTYHGQTCGDGSGECRGTRVDASREATAVVVVDEATGSGPGRMFRGHYVDAGITYPEPVFSD
jgi:hypothetical protein